MRAVASGTLDLLEVRVWKSHPARRTGSSLMIRGWDVPVTLPLLVALAVME